MRAEIGSLADEIIFLNRSGYVCACVCGPYR